MKRSALSQERVLGALGWLLGIALLFTVSAAAEEPELDQSTASTPSEAVESFPVPEEPTVTVSTEPADAPLPVVDEAVQVSTPAPVVPFVIETATPAADVPAPATIPAPAALAVDLSTQLSPGAVTRQYDLEASSGEIVIEKLAIDDAGSRLLVLVQTSRPVECFVFERRDPPSLFIQFMSSNVYAGGDPIQVVGIDPLSEIRYGYSNFIEATSGLREKNQKARLDYLELRLTRPVFYHVQQEGWVFVIGLDRTTTKVDVPELDFRFDSAQYEGAANLPDNPRINHFVETAQANSRLLAVARDEVELSKSRVWEARRALYPALTARVSETRGTERNPFPAEEFEGFEATTFKRDEYGLEISQPLYESGRLYGAYRQSRLNRLMAVENLRKQAQDLTYEVKKAYFTLLKNQSILRVRRELVAQGEVTKEMVRKKHKLDLTSRAEVLNVTAQADQSAYQLTGDEQDVSLARLVLISLLNQANDVPDPVPGALSFGRLSFNVESIIAWAQEHRPDVRIARLNAELARYSFKGAAAENNVRVDASGFIGRAGAAFEEEDFEMRKAWNIGLRVSKPFWGNTVRGSFSRENAAPDLGQSFITDSRQKTIEVGILDGLPGRSNARQAELQWERAKAELVEASRKAEFEVRETYYNLEKSARQLEAVREDLNFRQKDLEITREKTKLGLSELSQLMTAEVAYAQAQITEQDALAAYNVALADMDRVAGAEVVRE